MKHNHKLIVAIAFLGFVGVANAGNNPFEPAFDQACAERNVSTAASCEAWIADTQQSPRGKSEDAQLMIGSAYIALADNFDAGPQDKAAFWAQAREVFAGVVKQNPKSRDGLGALSMFAKTREEKITLLRQSLAAEPTNVYSLQSLARALVDENSTVDEIAEAAELKGRAYENYKNPDGYRWHLASNAISAYEGVGRQADADAIRAHALKAYGYDAVIARLSRPEVMNAEELNSTLSEVCDDPVILIGGAKGCLDSLKATTNAVATASNNNAAKLVEAGSRAMFVAGQAGAGLDKADPDWQKSFADSLDKFVASGHGTPTTYHLAADLAKDRHKRLAMIEAGAAKFPDSAELAYSAGVAELEAGRRDDAVRNLTRAKNLSPDKQHPDIDEYLERANKL